ncbi:hypothetical protein EYR38_003395 [Pleurotus pulmonarius]|nr:hypothetical protein EYR38_003395 [Pleurotus pulmonarius]
MLPTVATSNTFFRVLAIFNLFASLASVHAATSYANDFVDPDYVLAKDYGSSGSPAKLTIAGWARELAAKGPWTVTNKTATPPTGDKRTYMSWAPYWWPDCSQAGNTTALSDEQVWTTCRYISRDGIFNPDARLVVNDVGAFQDLSDAVLYNAIAWALSNATSNEYSKNVVNFVNTWFLDDTTGMLPNLDYAQQIRGPGDPKGSHTGVLDLKGMSKIVSGILILRKGNCPDWTPELDARMDDWSKRYITWLETADLAIEEALSTNNHGSFYYNQLAALYLLVNNNPAARNVTDTFFRGIYMNQIEANGEQPLEAARTRPYHYRAYNLAAMITNARIGIYAAPDAPSPFQLKTSQGATIQSALDFAITFKASASKEDAYASELNPNVAAVAAEYGDPDGKYAAYLKVNEPDYPAEAWFLWNQPLSDSGLSAQASMSGVASSPEPTTSTRPSTGASDNGAVSMHGGLAAIGLGLLTTLISLW